MDGTKFCNGCHTTKSIADFPPRYSRPGVRSQCKKCKARKEKWRVQNKPYMAGYAKNYRRAHLAEYLVREAKKRARKKGVAFSLCIDDIKDRLEKGACEISGRDFVLGNRNPFAPSLDRVDPKLGYTEDNTRVVCLVLNLAINDWGLAPVLEIASLL